MTTRELESRINNTIHKLSDPVSYAEVCHEHQIDEPLPSKKSLGTVIEMVREILFPGYFGNTSLRPGTTKQLYGRLYRWAI